VRWDGHLPHAFSEKLSEAISRASNGLASLPDEQFGFVLAETSSVPISAIFDGSSCTAVIVVQAIQNLERDNLSSSLLFHNRCSLRNPLLDPLMWPGLIEISHGFTDHAIQMALPQNQDVIQAFSPYASQQAFANRICFWISVRRFQDLNQAVFCLCWSKTPYAVFG